MEAFLADGCEGQLIGVARAAYTVRGYADFDGYRRVLTGRADAMIDPGVQPYDICPAAVLLAEAGGRFTSLDGADSIYGGSGLGTNGLIHDELLAAWNADGVG
jgi:histidinol-phosphatase